MAFGGKMNDGGDPMIAQKHLDERGVADIAMDELNTCCVATIEIRSIARVGQRVEDHNPFARDCRQTMTDEVCADETGTAGYENGPFGTHEEELSVNWKRPLHNAQRMHTPPCEALRASAPQDRQARPTWNPSRARSLRVEAQVLEMHRFGLARRVLSRC